MTLSLIIVGAAVVMAGGIFAYDKYLGTVREKKASELKAAEDSISRTTVEEFIRLRNRFSSAETLLDQHVALSQFFTTLEGITVQNVNFDSLTVNVVNDRTATIHMTGSAKSFNALAAESSAFAAEKRIRRAIFSGISATDKGTVKFSLQAELDPRLVISTGVPATAAAVVTQPVATTTTASTTRP